MERRAEEKCVGLIENPTPLTAPATATASLSRRRIVGKYKAHGCSRGEPK